VTKIEIAQAIQRLQGVTKTEAMELTEAVLELIKDAVASGEEVKIAGFGKFEVKEKNPRRGRNPQTGEEMVLNGRRVLIFKPSAILKSRINNAT